jgi:tripartite-type tricarboxylate transporter receptor subunit TctC
VKSKEGYSYAATIPKYLGQGVIVDNKPGASGQIVRQYTMQAKPDGYTMHMLAIGSGVMTPALNPTLPIKWEAFT